MAAVIVPDGDGGSVSPIAVVVYGRDRRPDAMLAEAARRLRLGGLDVRGLLQCGTSGDSSRCAALFLDDIGTGRRIQVFEQRGRDTRGCRLDPSGLACAAMWVREAIAARPDILFVNRFGRQEAAGRGLLGEIGAAATAEIPVVVAVGEALLPDWRSFAGEEGTRLGSDAEALVTWCLARKRQEARSVGRAWARPGTAAPSGSLRP